MSQIPNGICVLVDGGCLNNNKPVSERKMYGSFTVLMDGKPVASQHNDEPAAIIHKFEFKHQDGDVCGHASNQLAELLAAIEAVQYAGSLQQRLRAQGKSFSIAILSDSEYALGHAQTFKPSKKADVDTITASQALKDSVNYANLRGAALKFQWVPNEWVKSQLGH